MDLSIPTAIVLAAIIIAATIGYYRNKEKEGMFDVGYDDGSNFRPMASADLEYRRGYTLGALHGKLSHHSDEAERDYSEFAKIPEPTPEPQPAQEQPRPTGKIGRNIRLFGYRIGG